MFLSLSATANHAELRQEEMAAPFSGEREMRDFSERLIEEIATPNIDSATELARLNSHTDDPTTQTNIQEIFTKLKSELTNIGRLKTRFVQQSNFGRSFVRHQYSLSNEDLTYRCMLTYRRKTSGWKLNQIWCVEI